jgi:DNA replication protein DnaD
MAKILDNWHTNGIKTAEDVEKSLESYQAKQKLSMSTFDTDDFFEAALKRSDEKMMERRKK